MDRQVNARIANLYREAAEWTASNSGLLAGELGFESDTGRAKVGDGIHFWNDLPYLFGGAGTDGLEGGGGVNGLNYPGLTFTGDWIRHVKPYGEVWYYEFLLTSSGTLAADKDYLCDVYLVGGGGQGASSPGTSSYTYPSPGGGSGYPVAFSARTLQAGSHLAQVGAGLDTTLYMDTLLQANKGGSASAASSSSSIGAGFEGTYVLYGDEDCPAGTGGGATRGSGNPISVVPGNGGGGCLLDPYPAPGPAYKRQTSGANLYWGPVVPTYAGFGAGAMGRTANYTDSDKNGAMAAWVTTPASGVAAIRIRV